MEVVLKNVRSKNKILEYLKSVDIKSENKHEEVELENLLISVVMIKIITSTLEDKSYNYSVSLVCIKKEDNSLYDNVFLKEYTQEEQAEVYYKELLDMVNNTNETDLYNQITSYENN